jgi:undecaprenyl-diphosphatase
MNKNYKNNKSTLLVIFAALMFVCAGLLTYILKIKYNMEPTSFDLSVQEFFFSHRNSFLNKVVSLLTRCGDTITIIALCIILLMLKNRRTYGIPVTIAALVGVAIYKPMKHLFLRARPDVALHIITQGGYSFPSGHATSSIIVYGLLFYLIQKNCRHKALKVVLSTICGFLAIFIGLSRIYVGVHWPTDVIGGWLIGGGVLLLSIAVLEKRSK